MTVKISDEEIRLACDEAVNMSEAATLLGISFTTFKRKAKALGCYKVTRKRVKAEKIVVEKECEHPECSTIHTGEYGSGRFCSQKCSRSASTLNSKNKKKTIVCKECNNEFTVSLRTVGSSTQCQNCKDKGKCRFCGIEVISHNAGHSICDHEYCQMHRCTESFSTHFGFDMSTIGTPEYHKEFQRVIDLLKEDYFDNKMSSIEIREKYRLSSGYFRQLFGRLNITIRNKSDAGRNAVATGRRTIPSSKQYNTGYHTAWNGTEIYYRSSYELKYAKELDEQKVEYLVEDLRIQYWDTQLKYQRTAIPDFYLPESNMIVEIKSGWTLDLQNMKDKKEAYIKHGYDFKLIVDFEEINI